MAKYIALVPLKAGKRGDGVTPVGGELELDKAAAKPLLEGGSIATPDKAKDLLAGTRPPNAAALERQNEQLRARVAALEDQVAALEDQVVDLSEQLTAAAVPPASAGKTDKAPAAGGAAA